MLKLLMPQSKLTKLILLNKPFGVLSQFTDQAGRITLADFVDKPDVYPAGRLDRDSEGLILLTNNGALQHQISHPRHKLSKTYWVQVEGEPKPADIDRLTRGVDLKDGAARALNAQIIAEPKLWPRDPPVRFRANVATSWLKLEIDEGRNRQVRRMTASIGYPTLRLVRIAIGDWQLGDLLPGEFREVAAELLIEKIRPTRSKAKNRRWEKR